MEPAAADLVWNDWDVAGYAALAFFAAVSRAAGFGWALVVVFLAA
jgi:hypothetical protein